MSRARTWKSAALSYSLHL